MDMTARNDDWYQTLHEVPSGGAGPRPAGRGCSSANRTPIILGGQGRSAASLLLDANVLLLISGIALCVYVAGVAGGAW